jgi:hypothetical protein
MVMMTYSLMKVNIKFVLAYKFPTMPVTVQPLSPPWRDIAGTLSCFVKITISVDINPPFENQVWARGLGQGH